MATECISEMKYSCMEYTKCETCAVYGMSSVAILYVEIYVLYIEIFMG